MTDSLRRPFERSGTAHLLAVSGLHVGWAFAVGRLLVLVLLYVWPSARVQRVRPRVALGCGLALAVAYGALAGFSLPTLRATSMAVAGGLAVVSGRSGAAWNALLGAALLVLALDPASLFAASFALSFLAVTGILLWQPSGRLLGRLIGCTLGASLATAPWVVWLGLPLSSTGILANLLLVPWFAGVAVPLGLVAAGGVFVSEDAAVVVATLARGAVQIGFVAADSLGGPDLLPPSTSPLVVGAGVSALFAGRSFARGSARVAGAFVWLALVLLALSIPRSIPPRASMEILFLDVGQGDATLVRSGAASWLVDAGPRTDRFDAGRRVVLPVLRSEGIDALDVLVMTHADHDHIGGALSVLDRTRVGELWVGLGTLEDPSFRDVRLAASARGVPIRVVSRGDEARVGTWQARVLWPPYGSRPATRNEAAIVLLLEGPEGCALLPADIPTSVEQELLGSARPCTLLKLGHHGSRTSTGSAWLAALEPEVAIASGSRSRLPSFPHREVRSRLRAGSVTLYETARFGAIRVSFRGPLPVVAPYLAEPAGDPP
jgi:competence protein ComEC